MTEIEAHEAVLTHARRGRALTPLFILGGGPMTARERKYIEAKAEQFERWSKKEIAKARQSDDHEEKDETYYHATLPH